MRQILIAADINQAGLNDRVARLRRPIIAATDNIGFEYVIVAQDVLRAANFHQRAESAAAAKPVRKVIRPATRRTELNRGCLFCGVAYTHCAKFIRQLHLHAHAAKFSRKVANYVTRVRCISIDINGQHWRTSGIDPHRRPQNFWLPHQIRRDLTLYSHDCSNGSMRIIENACGWSSKGAGRKDCPDDRRGEFEQIANEPINGTHKKFSSLC